MGTQEARASNYTRAQAFLDAGAHILSTDFPVLPTFFNSSYAVRICPVSCTAHAMRELFGCLHSQCDPDKNAGVATAVG